MDSHEDANPLLVLAKLSLDETIRPEVRVSAAGRLASILVPRDMKFGGETVNIDARSVSMMDEIRKNPSLRGVMERAARKIAASMPTDAESHILQVVEPEYRAAALTDGRL